MEKKQKVFEKIIRDYLISKKSLVLIEEGYGDLLDSENTKDYERNVKFIKKNVEITLQMMDQDARSILENEFILKQEPFWWMDRYSKSTFYRYRSQAIERFIEFYQR